MQDVVTRVHANEVFDAFFPSFDMHTDPASIRFGQSFEKAKVRAPQDAEAFDLFGGIGLAIAQPIRPQILIVSGQLRPVVRQHEPHPVAPHEIGVGQMLQYLAD